MYKAVAVATLATSAVALNRPQEYYEGKFFEWMQEHKTQFANGAEFVKRLAVFSENLDYIEAHNAKNLSYQLGTNQFAHLTSDEYADQMHIGALRPPLLRRAADFMHEAPKDLTALPASVDWSTNSNVVVAVKDQGQCGSCWSFSAASAIEGAYGIKYGKQADVKGFSEQDMVSCDTKDSGCNGGWMDTAFSYVKRVGGLPTETTYPYTSGTTGTTGTCQTGKARVAASTVVSYTDVTPGSIDALMSAVAKQPVSIAIQANQKDFQLYKSGVLTGTCGQRLDHGVVAVGYGTWTDGTPYWKVRNSWGPYWGMNGYILIERSTADKCGVLDAPSYPTL
jgi:C1A family cysteine protease